ncbi:MAG: hypothetical protein ACRENB_11425 [Gemmatimonadales bacterium]
MKTPAPITALASAALLGLAAACARGDAPSAPGDRSSANFLSSASGAGEMERVCSNAGLQGSYGFYRTGTTGAGPFAAVGLVTYDGVGRWSSTQTVNRAGFPPEASTGEYQVSADCSGKLFVGGQEVARFALTDRGKQLFTLSVVPGETVRGVEKKVGLRACSNATLNGIHGFYRTGTTPAGPLSAVGVADYDGAGSFEVTQTISRNGTIIHNPPRTDFYEVNADCTGRLINAATGQDIGRFVVVERGHENFLLSLSPGNAVTGVVRKLQRGHDEHDED